MSGVTHETQSAQVKIVSTVAAKLEQMLEKLKKAEAFARSSYQTDIFQMAEVLVGSQDGMNALADLADRFDESGVFAGGAWENPAKLQPPLVSGSLKTQGVYPIVEILSELRVLAIAEQRSQNDQFTAEEAQEFLREIMALNLEYIFPSDTEEERITGGPHRESGVRLFQLLAERLGLAFLRDNVVFELEQIAAQRPIVTARIRRMIEMAERIPESGNQEAINQKLKRFTDAVRAPTPMSVTHAGLTDYRAALTACETDSLIAEADEFVQAIDETGLVAPQYAILLRYLVARHPELLGAALGLSESGAAEFEKNAEFSRQIIKVAIYPGTCQSILGLRHVLESGYLSRQEVKAGLDRLVNLDLLPTVRRQLLAYRTKKDGVSANALLLAGALSVLGQPLGVGQGMNPTCQAARGISLWAQCSPAFVLEMVISAARDGMVELPFEGQPVSSAHTIATGRALDLNLDPVSIVLVPHLDRIYEEMMRRVAPRLEDGHRWVNPAFYGRWVPSGFASVFADGSMTQVADYADFVRRFFATHHPSYNDGHKLMYPNPVGICVTNGHGDYLGPHAISIQRISEGPDGELRVYFFNPNNEGRQDWGGNVIPTVKGYGELAGESSLPFNSFISRLYAFHFNPYEEGDAYAVPEEALESIEEAARQSWGRAFHWAPQ